MNKSNVRIQGIFASFVVLSFVCYVAGTRSNVIAQSQSEQSALAVAFTTTLEPVVTGLSNPLYVTSAHDGTNRLFIVEQGGVIKVLQPGSTTPTVFLDITSKVLSGGEQGLLGLAFHPQLGPNRRFFVYYTKPGSGNDNGAIQIAEYHVSSSDPNVADTTEIPILFIQHPVLPNHNGGMLEFGSDGFLYIGTGDGGGANDGANNAQNTSVLLGKILRIDINTPNGPIPYSSPSDNPFFGPAPGADEVYAFGMRNPWRFAFDRTTDQLYLGDVGQGAREEIDIVTLGGNYGWRIMEGSICNPNINNGVCTPPSGHIPPISEYTHSGGRCSITGGYVYRGVMSTLPVGDYVYADFCTGEIFLLQGGGQSLLLDTTQQISSFGEDEAGEVYVVGLGGSIQRLGIQAGPGGLDTIGLFNATPSRFFLKNTNSAGPGDRAFDYGPAGLGWTPVAGDWNGNGVDTVALYNPANASFYLKSTHTGGAADLRFGFGTAGAGSMPLAGDWNGDGTDTVGLYDPSTGQFSLRNTNSTGPPDSVFTYGVAGAGWLPIVGDWDGDGVDTVGMYNPATGRFFLRNSNTAGVADVTFVFGPAGAGWMPLAGDWDGNGMDTIGLFNPNTNTFFLKNSNSGGPADLAFGYGPAGSGWVPIVGDWDGM
jgi:glucose/arabinose dehydrogenase